MAGSNGSGPTQELFKLRSGVVKDKSLEKVYAETVTELSDDADQRHGFGFVEKMLIDRIATMFVVMKDREAMGIGIEGVAPDPKKDPPGFASERTWREFMGTMTGMIMDLQKAQAKAGAPIEGLESMRHDVEVEVGNILSGVLASTLSKADAKAVDAALKEAFKRKDEEIQVAGA